MGMEHHGQDIARAFVEARKEARGLPEYPGPMPDSLAAAYRLQARAILLTGGSIAGWKVGRIPPPFEQQFGSNRLAGPIFADVVVDEGAGGPEMPVFAEGFAAAEAEYLLKIRSLPPAGQSPATIAELLDHIEAVHVGIEIASSPFPGINAHGPAVTISDFGNNHGLVIGAPISDWRDLAFERWPVTLAVDGRTVGEAIAADMLDGPLGAVRFLFGLAATQGIALAPGQWISSGAVTGVHQVTPGARVEARFGERVVTCRIGTAVGRHG